jgi:chitodextrinase
MTNVGLPLEKRDALRGEKMLLLWPLVALAIAACSVGDTGWPPAGGVTTGPTGDTTPPSVPGNFTAAAAGPTSANLSWSASTDNVGVQNYAVLRGGAQIQTTSATNFTDISLAPGQTYLYTVRARDTANNLSASSAVKQVTTPTVPTDTTPPSIPTNLIATALSASDIRLTWSASTDNVGVAGYVIRRDGVQIATVANISFTDSCLASNTAHTYTVAAFDAANNTSAQTANASATTLAGGPPTTALGTLAASMASGTWAPFTMGGLNAGLLSATSQTVPSFMLFAARGSWDCAHKKLQFAGTSHSPHPYGPIAGAGALITWDDATNQWTKESYSWSSDDQGHSYYHMTVNPSTGDLYYRNFTSAQVMRRLYGTTGQASWVYGQVANVPNRANQVASGLEWFPELNNGSGGLVFVDQQGASWSNASLTSWSNAAVQTSGDYHNWSARAGGFIYWGGGFVNATGNNSTDMYRLSSTGVGTKMPDTPIAAAVNGGPAIVIAHPNGSDLLLIGVNSGDPVYRFDGSAWINVGTQQIGPRYFVGFPVPDYGVVVFLQTSDGIGTPKAVVYKP